MNPVVAYKPFQDEGTINLQKYLENNRDVSDARIEVMVKKNIPANTYSYISVRSGYHEFACETAVRARIFTFSPAKNGAKNFFLSVKRFFMGFNTNQIHTYGKTGIASYILGASDYGDGEKDFIQAYEEKKRVYVYLSMDGKDFDAHIEEEQKGVCSIS